MLASTHPYNGGSETYERDRWPRRYSEGLSIITPRNAESLPNKWEEMSDYPFSPVSQQSMLNWDDGYENGEDDEVEEIIRGDQWRNPPSAGTLVRSGSAYPDLAMIAPSPTASPLLEFSAPAYEEFTTKSNRRVLVDHFCNVLSHLIVFKEDTGNPFRQLILPLSHASSPVMNAIFALSSAHMEYRGVENEEKSLDFHNRAIQGLAQLIQQNKQANREEILGAIMLLVYYEVVISSIQGIITVAHTDHVLACATRQCKHCAWSPQRRNDHHGLQAARTFSDKPIS
jgi:hypothetical protein